MAKFGPSNFNYSTSSSVYGQVPAGRTIVRIPVDLGHVLRYLDSKRSAGKLEVTISHLTIKACAMVLAEMPTLNGQVINGLFYASKSSPAVDMSVSIDLSDTETVLLKIVDADIKPVDYISSEVIRRAKNAREERKRPPKPNMRAAILGYLSPSIAQMLNSFLTHLGDHYGISIPSLGVHPFPTGVCTVLNSPNVEDDADVDVSIIPDSSSSSNSVVCNSFGENSRNSSWGGSCVGCTAAPIIVSIGSVRVLAALDLDRHLAGNPVLNYSLSFDNRAASLVECRRFCSKLQKFLRDPTLLDKLD